MEIGSALSACLSSSAEFTEIAIFQAVVALSNWFDVLSDVCFIMVEHYIVRDCASYERSSYHRDRNSFVPLCIKFEHALDVIDLE